MSLWGVCDATAGKFKEQSRKWAAWGLLCASLSHAPFTFLNGKGIYEESLSRGYSSFPWMLFARGKCCSIVHLERPWFLKSILLLRNSGHISRNWTRQALEHRSCLQGEWVRAWLLKICPVKGLILPACLVYTEEFCSQSGVGSGSLNPCLTSLCLFISCMAEVTLIEEPHKQS